MEEEGEERGGSGYLRLILVYENPSSKKMVGKEKNLCHEKNYSKRGATENYFTFASLGLGTSA